MFKDNSHEIIKVSKTSVNLKRYFLNLRCGFKCLSVLLFEQSKIICFFFFKLLPSSKILFFFRGPKNNLRSEKAYDACSA